ncbi:hypothetical protein K501DRAFT_247022 [Backusella circina FSU 941]|nr:hypothetical protein K501DRAFT_247022 [Backusella circina FSU 941]
MTELHNSNNAYNNSMEWLDRASSPSSPVTNPTPAEMNNNRFSASFYQTQLPPINAPSTSSLMNTEHNSAVHGSNFTHSNINNESLLEDDAVRRSLPVNISHPYAHATASGESHWIPGENPTSMGPGYSPKDSCDLSYDGEDYHHNHGQPTPSPSASTDRSRSKKQRVPSTREIHVERNTEGKPPYSYATLIKYAIENSQRKKLTLSEIYQWVIDHYPFYGTAGTGWKNSIRHNLSLNKSFVRVARPINEPGKGSYWQVDYRAAEAEMRSKSSMAVKSRSNRSGSDPMGSPYRPDSWGSMNPTTFSGGNQRFNRDSRSMSLDSNSGKMGGIPNGFTASNSSSSISSSLSGAHHHNGGYPGYYGNTYTYNRPVGHPNHPQHRHSTEFPRNNANFLSTGI